MGPQCKYLCLALSLLLALPHPALALRQLNAGMEESPVAGELTEALTAQRAGGLEEAPLRRLALVTLKWPSTGNPAFPFAQEGIANWPRGEVEIVDNFTRSIEALSGTAQAVEEADVDAVLVLVPRVLDEAQLQVLWTQIQHFLKGITVPPGFLFPAPGLLEFLSMRERFQPFGVPMVDPDPASHAQTYHAIWQVLDKLNDQLSHTVGLEEGTVADWRIGPASFAVRTLLGEYNDLDHLRDLDPRRKRQFLEQDAVGWLDPAFRPAIRRAIAQAYPDLPTTSRRAAIRTLAVGAAAGLTLGVWSRSRETIQQAVAIIASDPLRLPVTPELDLKRRAVQFYAHIEALQAASNSDAPDRVLEFLLPDYTSQWRTLTEEARQAIVEQVVAQPPMTAQQAWQRVQQLVEANNPGVTFDADRVHQFLKRLNSRLFDDPRYPELHRRIRIPWEQVVALLLKETDNFQVRAVLENDGRGLAQINRKTLRELWPVARAHGLVTGDLPPDTPEGQEILSELLFDPTRNVQLAILYLRGLLARLDRYLDEGDEETRGRATLFAYNRGSAHLLQEDRAGQLVGGALAAARDAGEPLLDWTALAQYLQTPRLADEELRIGLDYQATIRATQQVLQTATQRAGLEERPALPAASDDLQNRWREGVLTTLGSIGEHGLLSARQLIDQGIQPVLSSGVEIPSTRVSGVGVEKYLGRIRDDKLAEAVQGFPQFDLLSVASERPSDVTDSPSVEERQERTYHAIVVLQAFENLAALKAVPGYSPTQQGYELRRRAVPPEAIDALFVPEHLVPLAREAFPKPMQQKMIPVHGDVTYENDLRKTTHAAPAFLSTIRDYLRDREDPEGAYYWMSAVKLPTPSDIKRAATSTTGLEEAGATQTFLVLGLTAFKQVGGLEQAVAALQRASIGHRVIVLRQGMDMTSALLPILEARAPSVIAVGLEEDPALQTVARLLQRTTIPLQRRSPEDFQPFIQQFLANLGASSAVGLEEAAQVFLDAVGLAESA